MAESHDDVKTRFDDIDPDSTAATQPDELDPYQIETVIVDPQDRNQDQKLSDLLDTHVRSRARAAADIAAPRPHTSRTVGERLLSSGVVPYPRPRRAHDAIETTARGLWGADSQDLISALGVPPELERDDDDESAFVQPLLVWLVEACQFTDGAQRRTQYCEVLLRIAEECGARRYAGLAALTLRYRRALLDGQDALTANAASTHMMQWPLLLDAYLREKEDLFAIDALLNHVAQACDAAAVDTHALDQLADTMLADAQRLASTTTAPDGWVSRAGDAVLTAGRLRVLSRGVGQQSLRLRAAVDETASNTPAAELGLRLRALLSELDEHAIDLVQTSRVQQSLARAQHASIARTWRSDAADSLASIRQAVRSAGTQRDINVHVQANVGDFRLDNEAVEVLTDSLAGLAWWAVHQGMRAADTPAEVSYSAHKERTTIHFELEVTGHGLDMRTTCQELGLDGPGQLAQRLLKLAADTTTTVGRSAALSASFTRLYHGVARLGGRCELHIDDHHTLHVTGSFPDWLTTTRGHLCPVGGGIVTVREAGIARVVDVETSAFFDDGPRRYVRVDDTRHPTMRLADLLDINTQGMPDAAVVSLLLVPVAGLTYAIETLGVSEALPLPLRALTEQLPRAPGVVGGTVLIGGEISPVVDLQTLVLAARK